MELPAAASAVCHDRAMKVRIGMGLGVRTTLNDSGFGDVVDALESLHFDSLWLSERIGGDAPDPLVAMAFAAGRTRSLKFGMSVMVLPGRNPVVLAKELATLDRISGGRVELGLGVGWMKEEFDALGMPYDHRGARADEQLELFRTVFSSDTPSFDGRFYSFPEVGFSPLPPGNNVPVWVGGDSDAAFRRTVKYGDAFHAAFQSTEKVAASWKRVLEIAEQEGRPASELRCSMRWYLDPDSAMKPAVSLQGSTQQMVDRLGELAAVGVDHLVLDPTAKGGPAGRLDAVRRFMAEVAPQVS